LPSSSNADCHVSESIASLKAVAVAALAVEILGPGATRDDVRAVVLKAGVTVKTETDGDVWRLVVKESALLRAAESLKVSGVSLLQRLLAGCRMSLANQAQLARKGHHGVGFSFCCALCTRNILIARYRLGKRPSLPPHKCRLSFDQDRNELLQCL
jgi:hypothetical protein